MLNMATLATAKNRHADHYLARLGRWEEQYASLERTQALAEFDRDWAQIAAAHNFVAVRDDERSYLFFIRARPIMELRRSLPERLVWRSDGLPA